MHKLWACRSAVTRAYDTWSKPKVKPNFIEVRGSQPARRGPMRARCRARRDARRDVRARWGASRSTLHLTNKNVDFKSSLLSVFNIYSCTTTFFMS